MLDRPLSFTFHDVNEAYGFMQEAVKYHGEWEETRNGRARAIPVPVTIAHHIPWRRVLFDVKRDANPFFHYMEAIWMLSGDRNVQFPAHFAANIKNYSDDGVTLHGAYGHRWRYHFGRDQIDSAMAMLHKDPLSRRVVINMWDPRADLEVGSKDLPCNTQLMFRVVDNRLSMTVINRSNDLVWGMLGANIVHMSILQEYMANTLEMPTGAMYQFTNNLHVYEGWGGSDKIDDFPDLWYSKNPVINRWLFSSRNLDLDEAAYFVETQDYERSYESRIMRDNVVPMYMAHMLYKYAKIDEAIHVASRIYDEDWRRACILWLERRVK